jgi:hypothetical protein
MVMQNAFRIMLTLATIAGLNATLRADDFRIETKVFSGKGKAPLSQNVTLFAAGFVYDYLSDPDRVAVFDRTRGRFILLDPVRKIKAEVTTDEVLAFSEKFHALASKSTNAFTQFAATPNFNVRFTEDGELTLSSDHITYRLQTIPAATPEAGRQYREFSDWYVRFNAMSNPGATPPFARLNVNEELADRGLVPSEVQLTIPAAQNLNVRAVSMRSEHHVSWRLLQRDQDKIAETANQLTAFKKVDFDEFQSLVVGKR